MGHSIAKFGGRRERGVALLVTLMVIAILVAVTVEAHRRVRNVVLETAAGSERERLLSRARSGIEIARAMLLFDKSGSTADSVQEDWARPEKRDELLAQLKVPPGSLSFSISDLMGRIQVNALVTQPDGKDFVQAQSLLWDRFLRPLESAREGADLNSTTDIINSLKDWLDLNDDDAVTGLNGAESDYYEGLDPPYKARNGPMRDVSELLLVKGVTPELYYGTEKVPGIAPFVTTYGAVVAGTGEDRKISYPGRINISTAPLPVIRALLKPEDADLAESIVSYREARESDTFTHDVTQVNWYKGAPGCSELVIDQSLLAVSSDVFEVSATARGENMAATVTAVLVREKDATGAWTCRIVSWRAG